MGRAFGNYTQVKKVCSHLDYQSTDAERAAQITLHILCEYIALITLIIVAKFPLNYLPILHIEFYCEPFHWSSGQLSLWCSLRRLLCNIMSYLLVPPYYIKGIIIAISLRISMRRFYEKDLGDNHCEHYYIISFRHHPIKN